MPPAATTIGANAGHHATTVNNRHHQPKISSLVTITNVKANNTTQTPPACSPEMESTIAITSGKGEETDAELLRRRRPPLLVAVDHAENQPRNSGRTSLSMMPRVITAEQRKLFSPSSLVTRNSPRKDGMGRHRDLVAKPPLPRLVQPLRRRETEERRHARPLERRREFR
nr:hypothetical protein Itr_chr08CG14470 [Ipomoea trifida]